jgi:hypothetical protein
MSLMHWYLPWVLSAVLSGFSQDKIHPYHAALGKMAQVHAACRQLVHSAQREDGLAFLALCSKAAGEQVPQNMPYLLDIFKQGRCLGVYILRNQASVVLAVGTEHLRVPFVLTETGWKLNLQRCTQDNLSRDATGLDPIER